MEQIQIEQMLDQIHQVIKDQGLSEAVKLLADLHPADRAEIFFQLEDDLQQNLINRFSDPVAAEILEELNDQDAAETAEKLSTERLADLLDEMDPDEAADVLGDLSPVRAALALAEMEDAEEVIPLLSHPDETAGGLMTTSYIALRRKTTAGQAIDFLRQISPEAETPYYLYVVDRFGKLIGIVGLRDLIVADPTAPVEGFMEPEVAHVFAGTDQEDAARMMARYDLAALPVVNENGVLQGVITHDDVIDVLEEEATEDVLNLAGIEASAISNRSYWSLRITEIVRARFLWLLVLFVGQTLTTSVLRFYESEMQGAISLAFFVPLLIGTGGNAGAQTVTTVIRAIALNEVRSRDFLRVIGREIRTGALLGLLLAVVAYGWVLLSGLDSPLAIVVSITVFAITLWANLVGAVIPVIASRLGVDPTVMSAPLISTLVDATGLLIYFSVAIYILGRVLIAVSARIILNPYSGRGRAKRLRPAMETAFKRAGFEYEIDITTGPQEAVELAARAWQGGHRPVIAAGGDGLVSEVVNGLHQAQPEGPIGPLGIIPLGTANDLAKNLNLPTDINQAAAAITGGKTKRIDLGSVEDWVFDNNSAIGLEPVVTIFNIEMVRFKGTLRYLVAALRAIWQGRSWQARLTWEDGAYEGPITLVTVGNGAITGGMFRMAPAADPTDGKLTFVHAYAPSRLKMLRLLPRTIFGDYTRDPAVHQQNTSWLEIEIEPGTPLQVDGEIRGNELTRLRYSILPGHLEIFHPEP